MLNNYEHNYNTRKNHNLAIKQRNIENYKQWTAYTLYGDFMNGKSSVKLFKKR